MARVGGAVLTLEQALNMVDSSRGGIDSQIRDIIASWVSNELIFQEAKRHGIENSRAFQQKLADAKRDLLIQDFLQRYLYSDTSKFSEKQLLEYYEQHAMEFPVREEMFKVNLMEFKTRERASLFAAALSRGISWDSSKVLLKSKAALFDEVWVEQPQRIVTRSTLYPEELWKVAATLNAKESSYPVKVKGKYYVVQMLNRYQPGTLAEFALVRDEVRKRMIIERGQKRYKELIGTLRNRYTVEVMFSPLNTSDTINVQQE